MKRRAVFLDRDGVLSAATVVGGKPRPPATASDLRLMPGVEDACRNLHEEGLLLVCVTNQPDIARGTLDASAVDRINEELSRRLHLDAVFVCPHDDADNCDCRKPRPGLLLRAAREMDIDLAGSVMVGDRWRDVEAGRRAGCATVFVDHGYNERQPDNPDHVAGGLDESVPWILRAVEGRVVAEENR